LLHLGNRAAVDQALSRLAEREQLIRAGRGVYLLPVTSRFGTRAPSVEQAVEALASQRGEVIVSSGAAAANSLGLTTQVPVRSVYLTSGRTRKMLPSSVPVHTIPSRSTTTSSAPWPGTGTILSGCFTRHLP